MLQNKVVVVTGGNSSIGFATARELIEQGAKVVITGRNQETLEKAAGELGATGMVVDQRKLEDSMALAAAVKNRFGKVNALFECRTGRIHASRNCHRSPL